MFGNCHIHRRFGIKLQRGLIEACHPEDYVQLRSNLKATSTIMTSMIIIIAIIIIITIITVLTPITIDYCSDDSY